MPRTACTLSGFRSRFLCLVGLCWAGLCWAGLCWAGTGLAAQQFVDQLVLGGFEIPVGIAFDAAHRMYVWERAGRVHIVDHGVRLPQPLIDISEEVGGWRDHGMLGFALDPDFAHNGRFYLAYVVDRHHLMNFGTPAYNSTTDDYLSATIARVTRYDADPATGYSTTLPGSRCVLLGETPSTGFPILYESHGIGTLLFGTDGSLLVSCGDGADYGFAPDTGGDPLTYAAQALVDGILRPDEDVGAFRAQMIDSLSGKVLRLDPTTGDGMPSNPFYDAQRPRSARSRVWALGLRNPFRMTLLPGSGSLDPTLGMPGVLFVGDVGWYTREELDVVTDPGANCGWPICEGLEPSPYATVLTNDLDAPNPLAGSGCTRAFFRFQDLLQQPRPDHAEFFPNPCDGTVGIPPSTPTFVHLLPALDWLHDTDVARVGRFANGALVFATVGASASGVAGAPFRGNASVAGCWHSGQTFPAGFGSCYYHADFGAGWIKRLEFDAQQQLVAVHDFATTALPLMLCEDPVDHAIDYVNLAGEVHAIRCLQQPPPTAVARVDRDFGGTPLTVQFDARASSDPLGGPMVFAWDFGDGTTSDLAQVGHTYVGVGGPAVRTARVTVSSAAGAATTTVPIALDNTPPRVLIVSPAHGLRYSLTATTSLTLQAVVTDAEHTAAQLAYQWRTTLCHNNHQHPGAADAHPVATTTLTPTPDDEFFAYRIDLSVTDAGGLRGEDHVWLFPDSANASTSVQMTTPVKGERFAPGDTVAFAAATTGNVQRVEYYVEGRLVGAANTPPFAYSWVADRTGQCTVTALAVGADGTCSNGGGREFSIRTPLRLQRRLASGDACARAGSATEATELDVGTLKLGVDSNSLVALRFTDLTELRGARVLAANLSFCAAADESAPTTLAIWLEDKDVADPLLPRPGNLHARVRTRDKVCWNLPAWRAGQAGLDELTADCGALVRQVTARQRWAGQLVFLLAGTGRRDACAVVGRSEAAPLLTIDYLPATGR